MATPAPPPVRFASAAELAQAVGTPEQATRAFLRRHFRLCRGQAGKGQVIAEPPHYLDAWIEIDEDQRRHGDPAILYRTEDVWPALARWAKQQARQGQRPPA